MLVRPMGFNDPMVVHGGINARVANKPHRCAHAVSRHKVGAALTDVHSCVSEKGISGCKELCASKLSRQVGTLDFVRAG